VVAAAVLLGRH